MLQTLQIFLDLKSFWFSGEIIVKHYCSTKMVWLKIKREVICRFLLLMLFPFFGKLFCVVPLCLPISRLLLVEVFLNVNWRLWNTTRCVGQVLLERVFEREISKSKLLLVFSNFYSHLFLLCNICLHKSKVFYVLLQVQTYKWL